MGLVMVMMMMLMMMMMVLEMVLMVRAMIMCVKQNTHKQSYMHIYTHGCGMMTTDGNDDVDVYNAGDDDGVQCWLEGEGSSQLLHGP